MYLLFKALSRVVKEQTSSSSDTDVFLMHFKMGVQRNQDQAVSGLRYI